MGRRIWVIIPETERPNPEDPDRAWRLPGHMYDCRVMSFTAFLPADGERRKKHLVKLWTDPGGTRVLTVGSIQLKDPRRVAQGNALAAAAREAAEDE